MGNNRNNIDAWIKRMMERPSVRNLQGVAAVPVAGSWSTILGTTFLKRKTRAPSGFPDGARGIDEGTDLVTADLD